MSRTERTRIDALTPEESAQMPGWADRWIAHGLNTAPADRPTFEQAVRDCYRCTQLAPPAQIVWVASPLILSLAAPMGAALLEGRKGKGKATRTVQSVVLDALAPLPSPDARARVLEAVASLMPPDEPTRQTPADLRRAVRSQWGQYLGGQFWAGGGWWGPSWTSFMREVCGLALPGDLWDRGRAYEATVQSACWWWPHTQFVMVSERPTAIHRELVNPDTPSGWGSHRLHRADGPAVVWPYGWGVYSWHGVRVPAWVIETPADTLTVAQVHTETNAEVRRVLMTRMGWGRYLTESGAQRVQGDDFGDLYEVPLEDGRTMKIVRVVNGTPEPDGVRDGCQQGDDGEWYKVYWLRVLSRHTTAREAVAWTNWCDNPSDYVEVVRT